MRLLPASWHSSIPTNMRIRRGDPGARRLVAAGAGVTLVFVILAVFAPAVAPLDQDEYRGVPQLAAPSGAHPFGTTNLRHDVASRVVFGARLALAVIALSTVLALGAGIPLGLVSGYLGGRLDRLLVLSMDALYAFPGLLLAIVAAFVLRPHLGPGVPAAALAISVTYLPQYYRVVRNATLSVREEPFVEAARATGVRAASVLARFVFPNVAPSLPVVFTLNAADAVLTLAALGFLGYGVPLETAEWGYDIARGISDAANGYWWTSLFPGLAIVSLVTGLSFLGEGLSELLDPPREAGGAPGRRRREDRPTAAPLVSGPPAAVPLRRAKAAPAPALSVSGLTVTYTGRGDPVRAVNGVSLEVQTGEALGLVGESGSGKSTLAAACLRLLPKGAEVAGTVAVDGREVNGAGPDELRRLRGESVGLVFQDPMTRLDPLQRIGDHLAETIRAHRPETSLVESRRLVALALGEVGIPPGRARQYPHELSGGMRQRVMIALAILLHPAVIVADEPTTSLDVLVEAQVLDLIDDLRHRLGAALLLVTHDLAVVAERCDRVAVMVAGCIVEIGPAAAVFGSPRHPYTKSLLASRVTLASERLFPGPEPEHPAAANPTAARHGGCPFAARCPEAIELCYGLAPDLEPVDDSLVACHLVSPPRR